MHQPQDSIRVAPEAVVALFCQTAARAIAAGRVEAGIQALDGLRACFDDPGVVDIWIALALIEGGQAAAALQQLDAAAPAGSAVEDRRTAVRALALRTLEQPDWNRLVQRVLAVSTDDEARRIALRVQLWH